MKGASRWFHYTEAIQNLYAYHWVLQIQVLTFSITVFRDVSLWKPQISELLLF
jgi:hypothetical protein